MCLQINRTFISINIFNSSLCILLSLLLTGCGAGGGNPANKIGALAPSSIAISPSGSAKMVKGVTTHFVATATYIDGSTQDVTTQVKWASSNNTIASIDSSTGVAIGITVGTVNITATLSGIASPPTTLEVTTATITAITITPATNTVYQGVPISYTAMASYSDNSPSGNVTGSVAWSSSNTAVASVGVNTGVVTSLTVGSTNISATSSNSISSNVANLTVKYGYLKAGTIQGSPLSLTTAVSTLAGSGTAGSANATGTAASFNNPFDTTTDGTNLYVADSMNHKIRKIVIATGVVTDVAGSGVMGAVDAIGTAASFFQPRGITTDGINLYVSDAGNNKIRKIVIATGEVTTLAGSGVGSAIDATGTEATFSIPEGITTDGSSLYVADNYNHKIRKIVIATGAVTSFAGSGTPGAVDATGTAASFGYPTGITTDGSNLYVTDEANCKIRKIIIATGQVTTLAGSGAQGAFDATGTAATFYWPGGITTDGSNLYVSDTYNHKIRKIVISTGVVTTLAGTGSAGAVNATGTAASFTHPRGITTDGSSLFVSDTSNHKIRTIQ